MGVIIKLREQFNSPTQKFTWFLGPCLDVHVKFFKILNYYLFSNFNNFLQTLTSLYKYLFTNFNNLFPNPNKINMTTFNQQFFFSLLIQTWVCYSGELVLLQRKGWSCLCRGLKTRAFMLLFFLLHPIIFVS